MEDIIFNVEGIQGLVAGAQITYSCKFKGSPVISACTAAVYDRTTNVTATLMPTGSCSISGDTVTLPTLVIPASPAKEYTIVVTPTLDGNVDPRKITVKAQKTTDGQ